MPESRPRRVLICAHDELRRHAMGEAVADAGFEVVAEAETVVEALRRLEAVSATLVVLTVESLGLEPLEIVGELRAGDDPPEVIVVSPDEAARPRALAVGAFDLIEEGNSVVLGEVAAAVAHQLATGERRSGHERRTGPDRRQHQDWSRVVSQRRADEQRRARRRRAADPHPPGGAGEQGG